MTYFLKSQTSSVNLCCCSRTWTFPAVCCAVWLEPLSPLCFDKSKLWKSALPDTSFLLLPFLPSILALADLHAPHKPSKHFWFSVYTMALTSLNSLGIYCELAASLCSASLQIRTYSLVTLCTWNDQQ